MGLYLIAVPKYYAAPIQENSVTIEIPVKQTKLRPEISSEMYIQYKLTFLEMQEYAHGDNQRQLLRDALSDKHTSKKELSFW